MGLLLFILGLLGICWMTYAVMPTSRKHWALVAPMIAIGIVALGAICLEAFLGWLLLSAFTGRPVECAIGVILLHALVAVAIWRSNR